MPKKQGSTVKNGSKPKKTLREKATEHAKKSAKSKMKGSAKK
jgi:hypothetical protein